MKHYSVLVAAVFTAATLRSSVLPEAAEHYVYRLANVLRP